MKLIKRTRIQVLSNGCLGVFHGNFISSKQFNFQEKDQKNSHLYQKNTDSNKLTSKYSSNYKKKYFASK